MLEVAFRPRALAALFVAGLLAATAFLLEGAASGQSALAAPPPPPDCHGRCQGVDVSNNNGKVDFKTIPNIQFAYIKATEGTKFVDSTFDANFKNATDAGLIRGAFHFAEPHQSDGKTQADYFIAHGGGWQGDGRTLPGALDFETGTTVGQPECWGMSPQQIQDWIRSFGDEYHARTTRWPALYFNVAFWTDCGNSYGGFQNYPLWIANPGVQNPRTPGWLTWTFWQDGQNGIDHDQFNGSGVELQNLAGTSPPPPPAPTPAPGSPPPLLPLPTTTPAPTTAPAPAPSAAAPPPASPPAAPPAPRPTTGSSGSPGWPNTGALPTS